MEEKILLGDQMITYRAKHDLTQEQLAERVGTTRITINRAENGKPVGKMTVAKIKMVLAEG